MQQSRDFNIRAIAISTRREVRCDFDKLIGIPRRDKEQTILQTVVNAFREKIGETGYARPPWVFVCTDDTYTVRTMHTHAHERKSYIREHVQVRGNRCTSGSSTRKGAGSLDTAVSTAGNSAEAASRPVEPRLPSGERHIFFNLSSIFAERRKERKKREGGT